MYQHLDPAGIPIDLPVGKIVCVGRNYASHAAELNNPIPDSPLLFIKPSTCAVALTSPIALPLDQGEVHHEVELALLVGRTLKGAAPEEVDAAIWGFGVGLDLTLRDVQAALKAKGHPWERAKAFDGACPLSPFEPGVIDWREVPIQLFVNGELRQDGHSRDMLNPVLELIAHMSAVFTLLPGDVIMTGTPAGVGPLRSGDKLRCLLPGRCDWAAEIR